ncbi:Transcription factor Dp [Galdieria sulphuraria]|uniref:Transcription factor DP-1 n=1 Tax=Galdieria sulphuraria TaxID=130081 RepID=M2XE31_GALSU|nr:transcription factor DP-1 [Galdieria sulphuraria]EME28257.1 transcription factor DP-1 [Galdieria sulphuraria]GJD08860.1 Transcription factor Dp [Galdieria sulphuraria]|eukprot:XP_005704777.1 transcription factor DP-1 [Galdieria sulphuraria]
MLQNASQRFNPRKKEISLQNYIGKHSDDLTLVGTFPSSLEERASSSNGMSTIQSSKQVNGRYYYNNMQSNTTNPVQSIDETVSSSNSRKRRKRDPPSAHEELEKTNVTRKPKRRPPSQSTFSLSTVPKRGLKLMTLTICDAIQGHGSTTYAQLAQDLALVLGIPLPASSELKNDPNMAILEKNIRRRVYDCLNVLIAIGIIEKTDGGRYLKWVGKTNFSYDQCHSISSSPNVNTQREETCSGIASYHKNSMNEQLLSQLEQKRKTIEEKRENLELLRRQECAFQRLIDRNRKFSRQYCFQESKIELPFILVRTPSSSEIFLETTEDQTMMKFKFTELFYLHGDAEVVTNLEAMQTNYSKSSSPGLSASTDHHPPLLDLKREEDWLPCDKENLPYFTTNNYQLSA